ncbi:hypothetical protein N7488_008812 [Penicillium malachiteum]|nr:hypothetical protein N7488_008812 [Penicillium malachiteum]
MSLFLTGYLILNTNYSQSAYTYSTVIGTLTVVEAVQHDDKRLTLDNLTLRLGWRWPFRGWTTALFIRACKIALFQIPEKQALTICGWCLYTIMIDVLLSSLYILAVHTIISQSSSRLWLRLPSWRASVQIIPAAILASSARSINFFIPQGLLQHPSLPGSAQLVTAIAASAGIYFFATAPAQAVFIRVSASMLPEEGFHIVTLDDRLTGNIGMVTAWKSWDRSSCARYYAVLGKAFLLKGLAWLCFGWMDITVYNPYVWEVMWLAA